MHSLIGHVEAPRQGLLPDGAGRSTNSGGRLHLNFQYYVLALTTEYYNSLSKHE